MKVEYYSSPSGDIKWKADTPREEQYRNLLFIFGDNNQERGDGNQAIIRKKENKNIAGIPTMKTPGSDKYSDDEFLDNVQRIKDAIFKIKCRLICEGYEGIILSKGGYGTGIAGLEGSAPYTYAKLKELIEELKIWVVNYGE